MFLGKAEHRSMINSENNEDLLISIRLAGVYNGKKDKRGEKLAETEEDKLEARTEWLRCLRHAHDWHGEIPSG